MEMRKMIYNQEIVFVLEGMITRRSHTTSDLISLHTSGYISGSIYRCRTVNL